MDSLERKERKRQCCFLLLPSQSHVQDFSLCAQGSSEASPSRRYSSLLLKDRGTQGSGVPWLHSETLPSSPGLMLRPRERGQRQMKMGRAGFTKSCGNQEVQMTLYSTHLTRKNINLKGGEGLLRAETSSCMPRT